MVALSFGGLDNLPTAPSPGGAGSSPRWTGSFAIRSCAAFRTNAYSQTGESHFNFHARLHAVCPLTAASAAVTYELRLPNGDDRYYRLEAPNSLPTRKPDPAYPYYSGDRKVRADRARYVNGPVPYRPVHLRGKNWPDGAVLLRGRPSRRAHHSTHPDKGCPACTKRIEGHPSPGGAADHREPAESGARRLHPNPSVNQSITETGFGAPCSKPRHRRKPEAAPTKPIMGRLSFAFC